MRGTGCVGRLVALLRAAFALTGTWRARDGVRGTACAGTACVPGMSESRENRGVFIEFVPVATVCRL